MNFTGNEASFTLPSVAQKRLVKASFVAEFSCCVPRWTAQYRKLLCDTAVLYPSQNRGALRTEALYVVCSKSIRIGVVVVVHWMGCVCNQSWHVRTCLSNSWHKLQVAAFAQLAAVGRGINTCVYVVAICTLCESTEQRIGIEFCFEMGKTTTETYQLLQQAYGEDGMGRTQVFDGFLFYVN